MNERVSGWKGPQKANCNPKSGGTTAQLGWTLMDKKASGFIQSNLVQPSVPLSFLISKMGMIIDLNEIMNKVLYTMSGKHCVLKITMLLSQRHS